MSTSPPAPFPSPYTPPGTPADVRKLIHFATDGVQPPSQVYVDVNDYLVIQEWTTDPTAVLFVQYRILRPNGEIIQGHEQFPFTGVQRNQISFIRNLTEGFLLSLHAGMDLNSPGVLGRGMTRIRVLLQRTAALAVLPNQVLIQGVVDFHSQLTWPGGIIDPAATGQGWMRSVTGTTPAAGAEVNEVVPALARWKFKLFGVTLTTSATVATRGVTLVVSDGTHDLFRIEAPSTQAASLTQSYWWGQIGARADKVYGTNIAIPIPDLVLTNPYAIRTLTTGLQVGDQYTAPQYQVEDWLAI
jgi:hypothetical protein